MQHLTSEEVLAHIDAAVGKPEDETEEEHQARVEMVERDRKRRNIAKKHAE